jgi:hypothetical protein
MAAEDRTHFRAMLDPSQYLCAHDIDGKGDVTVTIEKVERHEVTGEGGKKAKKPLLSFTGAAKKYAAGATVCKAIAGMYGPIVQDWVGKRVTLFVTTTRSAAGETVPCIRVRPTVPTDAKGGAK